jgi:hypothetical protein
MRRTLTSLGLALLAAGCGAKDPVYIQPTPQAIEVDPANMVTAQTAVVQLPVKVETADQAAARAALAMKLGLTADQVPQARRDDYDVELEWTIKNLSDQEGTASIQVNGANEFFLYDPTRFVTDPMEQAPPPPLLGNIPMLVPPLGEISGVFREDQLAEASQDFDGISRGGVNPQFALLTQWPSGDVTGGTGGELATIPSAAVAALIQFNVTFDADQHMVLEYTLRVRDRGDRLDPFPADPAELVPPSTTAFMPPPPMMMP